MSEQNETEQVQAPESNYIDVIKDLKANTVSKAEYERVIAENKTLAEAFATSSPVSTETESKPVHTQAEIEELSAKLCTNNSMTNLEFIKTSLALRDAVLEVHGYDPFLPHNSGYVENEQDVAKVNAIADGLRQMAEYAGNDDKLFNSELRRCCK